MDKPSIWGEPSFIMGGEAEYEKALALVEPLLAKEPQPHTPEFALATALVAAIDAYESEQGWNMSEPSAADLAEFRLDQFATA